MNEFQFYVKEGFYHVIDHTAYDHILFFVLMAVPLTFNSWKKLLWVSLAFTLGHTASIVLAVYDVVAVNSNYIEFLIVASIFVTGIYNLLISGKPTAQLSRWFMVMFTAFFGLIHGFGFASAFKMLSSGTESKWLLLLEFALGIELGQLFVVAVVLVLAAFLINLLRVSRKSWITVTSAIIVGIVLPLLVERWPF
ncbi:MAG: HupE/UreJ family protein [Nonlabens sp.]